MKTPANGTKEKHAHIEAHAQMAPKNRRTHAHTHTHTRTNINTHTHTLMGVRWYVQTEICVHADARKNASLFEHNAHLLRSSVAIMLTRPAAQVLFAVLTFYIL